MLERKVMMPDGIVRDRHTVTQITHLVGNLTSFDIESVNSGGDSYYNWQYAVGYDSSIDESGAYDIISELPSMVVYVDPVDTLLPMLTDEQAEAVTNLFPAWVADVAYAVGDRRKYDGKLYKCVQAHTSQVGWEPPAVPSLWVRTVEDPDEIPDWIQPTGAHDAYMTGDKVHHNDKNWICTQDNNVYEPGVWGWDELLEEDEE